MAVQQAGCRPARGLNHRLGIICALRSEARCFKHGKLPAQQPVELNEKTLLILSGMGRGRARQAAQNLVDAGADCLAVVGTAGALAPSLRPGDLVVAQQVCEEGKKYTADADLSEQAIEWLSRNSQGRPGYFAPNCPESYMGVLKVFRMSQTRIHKGLLACATEPVASAVQKQKLFERTGALAVDMESAGVLQIADRYGLPALVLRAIIDDSGMALPDTVLRRVDAFGEVDAAGLILDLARSPVQIPVLARLALAAHCANTTLKRTGRHLLARR